MGKKNHLLLVYGNCLVCFTFKPVSECCQWESGRWGAMERVVLKEDPGSLCSPPHSFSLCLSPVLPPGMALQPWNPDALTCIRSPDNVDVDMSLILQNETHNGLQCDASLGQKKKNTWLLSGCLTHRAPRCSGQGPWRLNHLACLCRNCLLICHFISVFFQP